MKQKIKLSVVVSVYNGQDYIEDCLKSVSFAEEIIVVNNSSTDKTEEIARKYTDKVFTRTNNPMLNVNKNYGFLQTTGDWVLSLDTDERVTLELAKEIKSKIQDSEPEISGYWIPRKNIIFGKWIEHTGWYPDHQLRLFRKNKGRFEEKHVHEMVKIEGKASYIKNPMLHHNFVSVSQFLQKINLYTPNEAEQLIKNGYKFSWQDAIRFPVREFLSRFFARKGYKDGFHGLMLSLLMAFYHFVVFANIWEISKFQEVSSKDFLKEVRYEFKKTHKEFSFWFSKEEIKNLKNPLNKFVRKIIEKINS